MCQRYENLSVFVMPKIVNSLNRTLRDNTVNSVAVRLDLVSHTVILKASWPLELEYHSLENPYSETNVCICVTCH